MIVESEHVGVVRDIYAAINKRDLSMIEQLLSENCVRHFPKGSCPIAGDHIGREKVLDTFAYLIRVTGGDYRIDVGGILSSEGTVASYHHESGSRVADGARLESDMLVKWHVEKGKVVAMWDYANDVPHLNEFLT